MFRWTDDKLFQGVFLLGFGSMPNRKKIISIQGNKSSNQIGEEIDLFLVYSLAKPILNSRQNKGSQTR